MRRTKKPALIVPILALLFFVMLWTASIFILNDALVLNARTMGDEIARRFSAEENIRLEKYKMTLNNAESGLLPSSLHGKEPSLWLSEYLDYVHNVIGISDVEIYASIDGKIAAATYWEDDEAFDPTAAEWYKAAIEADGEIVYSDAYIDARLGEIVVTLSKRIQDTDDVVAVDIYPSQLSVWPPSDNLPEGCRYYLSDSKGVLLYHNTYEGFELKDPQNAYKYIYERILNSKNAVKNGSLLETTDHTRGIFYHEMPMGWYSVITIPYSSLFHNAEIITPVYIIIISLSFVVAVAFAVRNYIADTKAATESGILTALGNTYYAMYMVNLEKSTYSILKGSDYIKANLPKTGNYYDFIAVAKNVIEPDARSEFLSTFSIENMQHLLNDRVSDFGGDFKRLFGDEYRWVHVQMLYDPSFEDDNVVLCFKDVNSSKESSLKKNELLSNSLKNLERMSQSRNMFFSNMSHDMRTPLNAIIGLSSLADTNAADTQKVKGYLKKINVSSRQLLELINDILDVSKLESGKIQIDNSDFIMKDKVTDLLSVFDVQSEMGKTFIKELSISRKTVSGDWKKVQQILNNLLSNAFKFTAKDGMVEFAISEIADDNSKFTKYRFVIKDNGVGMSDEFLKKIFVPYERETRFGAANISGTGLGTAIAHDLVIQMDGSIDVSSKLGEGTVFTVILPFRVVSDDISEQEPSAVCHETQTPSSKNILLAEDNKINMEIATELLEMAGYTVEKAENGLIALNLFKESEVGHFAAVLMDMQMPEMDGCSAAKAIRALDRPDAATVPIIAVTANAFSEDISKTKEAGMNAHLSKPIDIGLFTKMMEDIINNSGK